MAEALRIPPRSCPRTLRCIPRSIQMHDIVIGLFVNRYAWVVSLDSVYEIRTTRACSLYPPETRDTIHIRSAPSAPVFRGWWSAGRVSEAPKQPHAMCALAEGNWVSRTIRAKFPMEDI